MIIDQKVVDATDEESVVAVVNPTFGSDPEMFVCVDGIDLIVPVLDLLGGTKKEPRPLPVAGFYVQEDNVLAEFNIPPASTREKFVANIHQGIDLVRAALPTGYKPLIKTSHRFESYALSDPRAQTFGCDPDLNA